MYYVGQVFLLNDCLASQDSQLMHFAVIKCLKCEHAYFSSKEPFMTCYSTYNLCMFTNYQASICIVFVKLVQYVIMHCICIYSNVNFILSLAILQ